MTKRAVPLYSLLIVVVAALPGPTTTLAGTPRTRTSLGHPLPVHWSLPPARRPHSAPLRLPHLALPQRSHLQRTPLTATTITVTTTDDSGNCPDPKGVSLRCAILAADSGLQCGTASSPCTINFASSAQGTIRPPTSLPALGPYITLDGGGTPNTNAMGDPSGNNAVFTVTLDGSLIPTSGGYADGIDIGGQDDTVKGLKIEDFPNVNGAGGAGIGVGIEDTPSTVIGDALVRNYSGVVVGEHGGTAGVTIGGGQPAEQNIISGNSEYGILIEDSNGNTVQGNYIGTDATGTTCIGNTYGISILYSGLAPTDNNLIGGAPSSGDSNLIAGNAQFGLDIEGATNNTIAGNYIGSGPNGTPACAPQEIGAYVSYYEDPNSGSIYSAIGNTIGATSLKLGNEISGNDYGVVIDESDSNLVEGNYIGTNLGGTTAVPNYEGVYLEGGSIAPTQQNVVGGSSGVGRNIISGNSDAGMTLYNLTGNNPVKGNYIGTNAAGSAALPNLEGISVEITAGATIGGSRATTGPCDGACNLISGNTQYGVQILDSGSSTSHNAVTGNFIGTNPAGTAAIGNQGGVGVLSDGDFPSVGNVIGGTKTSTINVVSGNTQDGIDFVDLTGTLAYVTGNTVTGNDIGTDLTGQHPLANVVGVNIQSAAKNTIGGTRASTSACTGPCNIISGNTEAGVAIQQQSSTNKVLGNNIGTDITGTVAIPNPIGVEGDDDVDNTIGGALAAVGSCGGACNLMSGNTTDGIDLYGSTDLVKGNFIGTELSGQSSLNNGNGVLVEQSLAGTVIGGTTSTLGNLITGNRGYGVGIHDSSGIKVYGNTIGQLATGGLCLGCNDMGVSIWSEPAYSATNNSIGGTSTGMRNLIYGSHENGVNIEGASNNVVQNDDIEENNAGIFITDNVTLSGNQLATGNLVGGTITGAPDVIDKNGAFGVEIGYGSANRVEGNDISGNGTGSAVGPGNGFLLSEAATGNSIGGTSTGMGNNITGNAGYGMEIYGSSNPVQGNVVTGNKTGVAIFNTASGKGDTIGGSRVSASGCDGGCNVISGNTQYGVEISDASTNTLEGNFIGINNTGTTALPNGTGVYVASDGTSPADHNSIGLGGPVTQWNYIAGNSGAGIQIQLAANTSITGNDIGLSGLGNGGPGAIIAGGGQGDSVGGQGGSNIANFITGNGGPGVQIGTSTTDSTHVPIEHNAIWANGSTSQISLFGQDPSTCASTTGQVGAPNDYLPCPQITAASTTAISGTACHSCVVEVYKTDSSASVGGHGGGLQFLGVVTANSSNQWALTLSSGQVSSGQLVTATATTSAAPYETSEFAANVQVS